MSLRQYVKQLAERYGYRITRVNNLEEWLRREPLEGLSPAERDIQQIVNLLSITKLGPYAGAKYPAGYSSLRLHGKTVIGLRDPASRVDLIPVTLENKTILDIGCNQGGILMYSAKKGIKWGVGIDFHHRLINVANKAADCERMDTVRYYTFNLEEDPLPLIEDLLPESHVDIVYLLAVCKWIKNWREVIDYAASISDALLFETNGLNQDEQIEYACQHYSSCAELPFREEDRRLYWLEK